MYHYTWHVVKDGEGFRAKEHLSGKDGMGLTIPPRYTGNYIVADDKDALRGLLAARGTSRTREIILDKDVLEVWW